MHMNPKRSSSDSHISIELSLYHDHSSHHNPEHIPLLHDEFERPDCSNSKSKRQLQLEQVLSWIIKFHILLGERTIWCFEKLMPELRHKKRTSYCFLFLIFLQVPLKILVESSLLSKEALWFGAKLNFIVIILYTISGIYHWSTGKNFQAESDPDDSLDLNQNEGLRELGEKYALIDSLEAQAGEFLDRHQNIPQDLALAIFQVTTETLRLRDELFVASEILTSQGGLTSAEILAIPIELYSNSGSVENKPNMCSLCIKSFKGKEELRRLRCGHRFHVNCIDDWLKQLAACPDCKARV